MTGCVEVKSEKYQTRKSPAYHAKDCKDLTKKGKDGTYISKADAKGIYKWVKVNSTNTRKRKGKFYDTHDNGSKAFRVYVDNKQVSIYKGEYKKDDTIEFDTLVKEVKAKEVFIGKPEGNSILLQLSENRYMHIGTEVYEFTMEDEVDHYYSMIGNSDVPYPVLLGTHYVYFMLDGDHTYVSRDKFPKTFKSKQWENAYLYYYGWIDPETGKSRTDKERKEVALENYAKKMKGFKMIDKRRF